MICNFTIINLLRIHMLSNKFIDFDTSNESCILREFFISRMIVYIGNFTDEVYRYCFCTLNPF